MRTKGADDLQIGIHLERDLLKCGKWRSWVICQRRVKILMESLYGFGWGLLRSRKLGWRTRTILYHNWCNLERYLVRIWKVFVNAGTTSEVLPGQVMASHSRVLGIPRCMDRYIWWRERLEFTSLNWIWSVSGSGAWAFNVDRPTWRVPRRPEICTYIH